MMKQLQSLEPGGLPLADDRVTQLYAGGLHRELKRINRPRGYPEDRQAEIKALLPNVAVKYR